MSYWNEVKDVVLKGVDLALANIKTGAEQALEAGKGSVSYLQLKKDLYVEQRNLHTLLADFGDIAQELYLAKGDFPGSNKVKEISEKVSAAEVKCKAIEENIKNISKK